MANKLKNNLGLEDLKNDLLRQLETSTSGKEPDSAWKGVLQSLHQMHFPGQGNEEWKYSAFNPPKNLGFKLGLPAGAASGILPEEKERKAWQIVFWDGVFQPRLSDLPTDTGFSYQAIADATDWQEPYETGIFSELNRSTATNNGIVLRFSAETHWELPFQVSYHFSTADIGIWAQPRLQVWVEKNTAVTFSEHWHLPPTPGMVINAVIEIHQEAGSQLRWTNLENGKNTLSHIHQTRVWLEEAAFFQHLQIAMGEGFIRNNLEIKVAGSQADAHMYGLTLGDQKLHVDNHTFVNHKEENTTSNQLYKTIMAGKSTAVFNGKILVDQKAQKTNAYQSSKNLLITADAKVFAKPQLEIFADDVKCSHGATIGQLDEEPIFYLRSRGLDESAARKLLVLAFAGEILDKEENENLRQHLHRVVDTALESIQLS